MLIKGPGFGLTGPALLPLEKSSNLVDVRIQKLDTRSTCVWHSIVPADTTIGGIKILLCKKTKLQVSGCCLGKDPPIHPETRQPVAIDYMNVLKDNESLESLKFSKTAE